MSLKKRLISMALLAASSAGLHTNDSKNMVVQETKEDLQYKQLKLNVSSPSMYGIALTSKRNGSFKRKSNSARKMRLAKVKKRKS